MSDIVRYIMESGAEYWSPTMIIVNNEQIVIASGVLHMYLQRLSKDNTMKDTNKYQFGIDGKEISSKKTIELVHYMLGMHNCMPGHSTNLGLDTCHLLAVYKFIDMYFDPIPEVKSYVRTFMRYIKKSIKQEIDLMYNAYRILYFGVKILTSDIKGDHRSMQWLINVCDGREQFVVSNLNPNEYSDDYRIRIPYKYSDTDYEYTNTNLNLLQRYAMIHSPFKFYGIEEISYIQECYKDSTFIDILSSGYLTKELDIEDLVGVFHDYPLGWTSEHSIWDYYCSIPAKKKHYLKDDFYENIRKKINNTNYMSLGIFNRIMITKIDDEE